MLLSYIAYYVITIILVFYRLLLICRPIRHFTVRRKPDHFRCCCCDTRHQQQWRIKRSAGQRWIPQRCPTAKRRNVTATESSWRKRGWESCSGEQSSKWWRPGQTTLSAFLQTTFVTWPRWQRLGRGAVTGTSWTMGRWVDARRSSSVSTAHCGTCAWPTTHTGMGILLSNMTSVQFRCVHLVNSIVYRSRLFG